MLIGPHVKRGYVSHTLADFGSIIRLIFTRARTAAAQSVRCRRARCPSTSSPAGLPTSRPYDARPPDRRVFDPGQALKPFDRGFNWKQLAASPRLDDPEDMRRPFEEPGAALAGVVMGRSRDTGKAAAAPQRR